MFKRNIFFLIASIFILISLSAKTYGCTCRGVSPCAAYESAKAIFVGKMIGGTERNEFQDSNGNKIILEAGFTRFEVEEAFKGVSEKEVVVFIDIMKGTSCEWSGYRPGQRYLIFAREYDGKLTIGPCGPSKWIQQEQSEEAKEPNYSRRYFRWEAQTGLKFLRGLSSPGTGGRIFVTAKMMEDDATSVRGASVVVKGQGDSRFETVTDEYGEAVINNLPPGKYTVTTNWPKGITGWHQPEIEITEHGCSELQASAILSGVISGQVLDNKGQLVQIPVYVSNVPNSPDQKIEAVSSFTKDDGSFEIGDLPPGKYLLYLSANREDKSPYFYPGVFDKAKATMITIGLGEKTEDLEFKLPSAFETQTIKGKVVTPDGKPVAKAYVYLGCPLEVQFSNSKIKIPEPDTKTDSEGNFTLTGFKGFSYSIQATLPSGAYDSLSGKEYIHAPLIRIVLTEELGELRLILSESTYGPSCKDEQRQRGQN